MLAAMKVKAPIPARRPKDVSLHGETRIDDWHWLRDRDDPEVIAHLHAENAHTEAWFAPLAPLAGDVPLLASVSVAKAVPQDKIQRLTRLVENAVGVDAERGDSVVIESMPFSVPTDPGALDDSLPLGLTADQILSILKLVVIGVIGLFVLRMLKGRLSTSKAGGATPALAAPGHGEIALIGAGAGQAHGSDGQPGHPQLTYASPNGEGTHLRQGIELAQADSAEKSSALDRVGQAVADNPAEAAALVRQWLNG